MLIEKITILKIKFPVAIQIKRLKNKVQIDKVFTKGKSLKSNSLVVHYISNEGRNKDIFVGINISKKNISLAVNRNKIKRKIRACIILEEKSIRDKLVSGNYMILFKGRNKKDESFNSILESLQELIKQFSLKNLSI
tara:strand:+ start:2145 stop:2555 length:411 start_codon:yes stop_codon:yes gene_type:complete